MNKYIKYSVVLIVILLSILGAYSLYKRSVISKIDENSRSVGEEWAVLFEESDRRLTLISDLLEHLPADSGSEALCASLRKNEEERADFKLNNAKEFIMLEYDTNSALLNTIDSLEFGSDAEIKGIIDELIEQKAKINMIAVRYNSAVMKHNQYFSVFPNFAFARETPYSRKLLFTIKYGEKNQNPKEREEEIQRLFDNLEDSLLRADVKI